MTDLEMTRLCAEAMGIDFSHGYATIMCKECDEYGLDYDPLHVDAQAMALVKKLNLIVSPPVGAEPLYRWYVNSRDFDEGIDTDLNRAIVECVAKMQAKKVAA